MRSASLPHNPPGHSATQSFAEIAAILATGVLRLCRRSAAYDIPTTVNLQNSPESLGNSVDDAGKPWLHVTRVNTPESATGAGEQT